MVKRIHPTTQKGEINTVFAPAATVIRILQSTRFLVVPLTSRGRKMCSTGGSKGDPSKSEFSRSSNKKTDVLNRFFSSIR